MQWWEEASLWNGQVLQSSSKAAKLRRIRHRCTRISCEFRRGVDAGLQVTIPARCRISSAYLLWLRNPAHKPGLCAEYSRCLRGSEQSHWNSLFIGVGPSLIISRSIISSLGLNNLLFLRSVKMNFHTLFLYEFHEYDLDYTYFLRFFVHSE